MSEGGGLVFRGRTLRRFVRSGRFVDLIVGPYGGGKTVAACYKIMQRCCGQMPNAAGVRRTRWIILRTTFNELKHTTLKTWMELYGPLGRLLETAPFEHRVRFALGDGTRVEADFIFLALDHENDVDKLGSFEVTGAYVNEVREVPRGIVDTLTGRVGRFPRMADGGPTWWGVLMDTNPPDEDHWLAEIMADPPDNWGVFRQPGAMLREGDRWVPNPLAENVENLVPGYYENMVAGKNEDWIRVYIGGEIGFVREGRPVFPEYLDTHHTASAPLNPIPGREVIVGLDAGLWPAAVFMQRDDEGRILVLDELVGEGIGARAFAEELIVPLVGSGRYEGAELRGAGDPAGAARSANADHERSWLAIVQEHSAITCRPVETNDPVIRREALAQPLARMVAGRPGVIVDPRCRILRRALSGGYAYRRLKVTGQERYTDKPEKNRFSHPAEAATYGAIALGEHRVVMGKEARKRRKPPTSATTDYLEFGRNL